MGEEREIVVNCSVTKACRCGGNGPATPARITPPTLRDRPHFSTTGRCSGSGTRGLQQRERRWGGGVAQNVNVAEVQASRAQHQRQRVSPFANGGGHALQLPHATVQSLVVADAWLAWHSMPACVEVEAAAQDRGGVRGETGVCARACPAVPHRKRRRAHTAASQHGASPTGARGACHLGVTRTQVHDVVAANRAALDLDVCMATAGVQVRRAAAARRQRRAALSTWVGARAVLAPGASKSKLPRRRTDDRRAHRWRDPAAAVLSPRLHGQPRTPRPQRHGVPLLDLEALGGRRRAACAGAAAAAGRVGHGSRRKRTRPGVLLGGRRFVGVGCKALTVELCRRGVGTTGRRGGLPSGGWRQ
jgi:hypothetical protein